MGGLLRGRCFDCVTKRGISIPSVIARRSRVRGGGRACRMACRLRDVLAGFSPPSFTHFRPGTISMPSVIARLSRVRGGGGGGRVCRMAYRFRDGLAVFFSTLIHSCSTGDKVCCIANREDHYSRYGG